MKDAVAHYVQFSKHCPQYWNIQFAAEKAIDFFENRNITFLCHESVHLLLDHIPRGKVRTWTPAMCCLLLEVKRQNLMLISPSIDLSPPKNTGKRQREVINTNNEIASMAALQNIPLDPILYRTTIPIPQILVSQGTRLPFLESVPTFYDQFYKINHTFPYLKVRIGKVHIFHRCMTQRNVRVLYERAQCHAP